MADSAPSAANRRPKKPPIKFNGAYCCSYNLLIFKFLQVGCLLATVICASQFTGPPSLVYIQIVSALGVAASIAWILLFCLNLNARFPDFFPVLMMGYHFILALLTIGVAVCCGIVIPEFKASLYPEFIVATLTSLIAAILFTVDGLLNILWWRGAVEEVITTPCSPWQHEVTI